LLFIHKDVVYAETSPEESVQQTSEKSTHLIVWATMTPKCALTNEKPHKWPKGHDFADHPVNAICPYCKSGEKHPEAVNVS